MQSRPTMWTLTIEDDEGQRTSLDLSHDEYAVGRAEDASIRLTERNVSRQHAVLRISDEDGWVIEDQGSYNGTFVNGERVVASRGIAPGDLIQLGDYRVELNDKAQDVEEPVDERQVRPDRLVVVIGPVPGTEFPLNGDRLSLGRAEEANISINHASVSRLHAELHSLGQSRWEVVDHGSSNGIRINGAELRRGIIEPGDALELGDVRLRFVAAGKYYRPMVDISQQLAAVPFDNMTPAATSAAGADGQRKLSTFVAVGAVLCVLALGAYVVLRPTDAGGPDPAGSTAPMATSEAEARLLLKQAVDSVEEDIEFAHKLLKRIPENSAVRDSDKFKEIEDSWADAMFAKADKIADPNGKRKIWNLISETGTVSAAKRKKAAQMALELGPPIDLDKGRPAPVPGTGAAVTAATTKSQPAPIITTSTTRTTTSTKTGNEKFNEKSQKRSLIAKMHSGRASEAELRMLKAICMNDGDRACRNQAVAKLNELRKKKNQ